MPSAKKTNSNKKKTTSSKNYRKKNNSRTSNTRRKKQNIQNPTNEKVHFSDIYYNFSRTRIWKFLKVIIIILLFFSINLLISWNSFNKFFLFGGIEIIALAFWYLFKLTLSTASTSQNNENENE